MLTAVLVDVTTLTEVAVLVAPGAVEVIVAVLVVTGNVEVVVLTEVAVVVAVVVEILVEPCAVVVIVAVVVEVAVLDPVLTAVSGGTLNVANPVFAGCAESCEVMMTSYAVAFTRVGSVPMLSGPVHTSVVVE